MARVFRRTWNGPDGGTVESPYWYMDLRLDGKRLIRRTEPPTTSRREAEAQLARAVTYASSPPSLRLTLGELLDRYEGYLSVTVRHSTLLLRAPQLAWWRQALGHLPASGVMPAQVDPLLAGLRGKYSESTVRNYGAALKIALNWAVKNRLLHESPLMGWTLRYAIQARSHVFTDEDIERLCAALPRQDYRDLTRLMLTTGLRLGDAVALEWESLAGGRLRLSQGKTGDLLWVPLSAEAKALVAALGDGTGRVFPHVVRNTYENVFMNARRRLGLPGSPHDLRRTFASRLYARGVPREVIARLLGQRSTSLVHHYAVMDWDLLERAVQ
jgi:integrase